MIAWLLACAPDNASGELISALPNVPPPDDVIVTATSVDGRCGPIEALVVDGTFAFQDLCRGSFELQLRDDDWSVDRAPTPLGRAPLTLRAWPVPRGGGAWWVREGGAEALQPLTGVRDVRIGDLVARWPEGVPDPWPQVAASDWLVFERSPASPPPFVPLNQAPSTVAEPVGAAGWWFLDVAWDGSGAVIAVPPPSIPSDAVVSDGPRGLTGIPGSALAGRRFAAPVDAGWALLSGPDAP